MLEDACNLALPEIKRIFFAAVFTFFFISSGISGQPKFSIVPGIGTHLSSSSFTPSPSVSGIGHPWLRATPKTFGHLSSSSLIPSLSESDGGHPSKRAKPGTEGHLSSSSLIPSLSVSGMGQPPYLATPFTVGHLSLLSITPSPSVSTGGRICGGGTGGSGTSFSIFFFLKNQLFLCYAGTDNWKFQ